MSGTKPTCPLCGAALRQHTTEKKGVLLICTGWPKCQMAGTPQTVQALRVNKQRLVSQSQHQSEMRLLSKKMDECRVEMSKRYAELKSREPLEEPGRAVRLGEYVDVVADGFIEMSRRKRR